MPDCLPFIAQIGRKEEARWIASLKAALPDEEIIPFEALSNAQRERAEVAIVANPDPAMVQACRNLRWVQSLWAGVERLALDLKGQDLTIMRLIDPELARTMAEAVLAWTLYLHRDMPRYAALQREKKWHEFPYILPSQRRIGLLGLGALGGLAATTLLQHGFAVSGWSRTQREISGIDCFSGVDGLHQMLAATNILVCLLPLTPATRGLIDREVLAALPKEASLINFGRGPVINMPDLFAALDQGDLAHAVLDVFEVEPLPASSPLWNHPRITILPHISAATNMVTATRVAAANIRAYRQTGIVPRGIDPGLGY